MVLADPGGPPRIETPRGDRLSASISHSGGAAVAVTASPGLAVGIDLEPRARGGPALRDPALAFGPDEAEAVARLGPLRAWCAKEAAGKALGTGLTGAPLRLRLKITASGDPAVLAGAAELPIRFVAHDRYDIALCVVEAAVARRAADAMLTGVPA